MRVGSSRPYARKTAASMSVVPALKMQWPLARPPYRSKVNELCQVKGRGLYYKLLPTGMGSYIVNQRLVCVYVAGSRRENGATDVNA